MSVKFGFQDMYCKKMCVELFLRNTKARIPLLFANVVPGILIRSKMYINTFKLWKRMAVNLTHISKYL
jgi:hypothetical protein